MMSNSRSSRAEAARETLKIIEQGGYTSPEGREISIKQQMQTCLAGTVHYRPQDFEVVFTERDRMLREQPPHDTVFNVENITTLAAAQRLQADGLGVLCLNFASARHPGGGFLKGARAQEESLARSSGLYASLLEGEAMYKYNRAHKTLLYSDHMIYSPDVPIFRDDNDDLLEQPYSAAFITSPAVNMGALRRNQPKAVSQMDDVMLARVEKLLSVAVVQGHDALILGAWGCGVFENDPATVAGCFRQHLIGGRFKNAFKRVIFAVLDHSKEGRFIEPFRAVFA